jgi:hypothetical protein
MEEEEVANGMELSSHALHRRSDDDASNLFSPTVHATRAFSIE